MPEEVQILDRWGKPIEKRGSYRNPDPWMFDWIGGGGGASTANERVNSHVAMTVMAFFACVRNISEDIAKLPKKVKQKDGKAHIELPNHPLSKLFKNPSSYMNRNTFWRTLIGHRCAYHGAFAYIARDANGAPVELVIMHPDHVQVCDCIETSEHYYRYNTSKGTYVLLPHEVFHLMAFSDDGCDGYTLPVLAKQLMGAAIALQKYRGAFFGNGAAPSGLLTHPSVLNAESVDRLKRQFDERYAGAANSNKTILLEDGLTWTQVSTDNDKAQMVELTNITVEDICRMFRMPPHKIQHLERSTNNNIEHQGREYGGDSLDPTCEEISSEFEFKCLTQRERDAQIYVDVSIKGLLRGDTAARIQFYDSMFNKGAMSANDILGLEDENPVPDGDKRYVMLNMVPVDRVDDVIDKQVATPEPQITKQPTGEEDSDTEPEEKQKPSSAREAFRMALQAKIEDLLRLDRKKAQSSKDVAAFYKKNESFITDHMAPFISAVIHGLSAGGNARDIAADYALIHCAESLQSFDGPEWPDTTRAQQAAEKLMEVIENGI